jgi:hypothetical protein
VVVAIKTRQVSRRSPGPSTDNSNGDVDNLDPKEASLIPPYLNNRRRCFNKHLASKIAPNTEYNHAINLKKGKTPPNLPIYNLSARELDILRDYLDNSLKKE